MRYKILIITLFVITLFVIAISIRTVRGWSVPPEIPTQRGKHRGLSESLGGETLTVHRGHRIPQTVVPEGETILYVWKLPKGWDIGDGWLLRVGDRYYVPEDGAGFCLHPGDRYEMLTRTSDAPAQLVTLRRNVVAKDSFFSGGQINE